MRFSLSLFRFRIYYSIDPLEKCIRIDVRFGQRSSGLIQIMADSDSDDILSTDFLEPGELLDSDDEHVDNKCTSARTSQSITLNRPKV